MLFCRSLFRTATVREPAVSNRPATVRESAVSNRPATVRESAVRKLERFIPAQNNRLPYGRGSVTSSDGSIQL
jgi:hypothetical protein